MSLITGGHYTGPPSGYRDYAQRQKDKGEAEYVSWAASLQSPARRTNAKLNRERYHTALAKILMDGLNTRKI